MAPINKPIAIATLAGLALKAAESQVGQCEQPAGSNSGPMIDEYLACVGLKPGYAWCQAFMYWCYSVAAKQLKIPNPMIRTAGVHDCWNRTQKEKRMLKADMIKTPELIRGGDQFILFTSVKTGHTGIVERIMCREEHGRREWIIYTIEGNSNKNGSRKGIAVVRHERKLTDKALQGFIRYSE